MLLWWALVHVNLYRTTNSNLLMKYSIMLSWHLHSSYHSLLTHIVFKVAAVSEVPRSQCFEMGGLAVGLLDFEIRNSGQLADLKGLNWRKLKIVAFFDIPNRRILTLLYLSVLCLVLNPLFCWTFPTLLNSCTQTPAVTDMECSSAVFSVADRLNTGTKT